MTPNARTARAARAVRAAALVVLSLLSGACGSSRAAGGAAGGAAPDAAPGAAPVFADASSASASSRVPNVATSLAVVPVHVTYVLRALRPALDSIFPPRDSLARNACAAARGLVCHGYVYQRDSLLLRAEGDRLHINTRLGFRARLGAPGVSRIASCGYAPEPMRRADLAMTTSLYWRRDWRIGARGTQLAATMLDPCTVSAFGVNVAGTLQDVLNAQLATFAAQADTAIPAAADLRPLADSLWRSFLEPTALDTAGSLWLTLEPEAVRVAPFTGAGPSLRTSLVLYARPRIVSGARPRATVRPLPALALGDAPRDFDVPVVVELPFTDVERRATALLAEETAASSVRVEGVRVAGRGDSVRIDLAVAGSLRGTLSLMSRPRWDPALREVRLDDLDWTLESRGTLARVKATLAAPLVGRAVRRATGGGRVPLGAQLDSARAELLRKLNGPVAPDVALGSSVTGLTITAVATTPTAFVVRARLTGQANVYFR